MLTKQMAACCHVGVLSTSVSTCNVQLACNQQWIAVPEKDSSFAIFSHDILKETPKLFQGHKQYVTALCFGNKEEPFQILGSGSEDCIIVWYLKKNTAHGDDTCNEIRHVTVAKDLGYIQHISFSNSDDLISICVGNEVWIVAIETCELNSVIEGHLGVVTASKFCPSQCNVLVTISEDRTFQVWDVDQKSALYHSPIISAYSFLSIAFHPCQRETSIGSADGMVRIFSLEDRFNCIHTLDLNKFFAKNQRDEQKQVPNYTVDNEQEPSLSVMALLYSKVTTPEAKCNDNSSGFHVTSELLQESVVLVCGTTNAVFLLNVNTCQLISVFDFRDPIPAWSKYGQLGEFPLVPLSGSCVFSEDKEESKIVCLLGSFFQNTVHIVHMFLPRDERELAGNMGTPTNTSVVGDTTSNASISAAAVSTGCGLPSNCPEISVLSKAPLCEHSPLTAELIPKAREKSVKSNVKKPAINVKKKSSIENRPVTFKTKIKSSGYTTSPRTKMFSPKVNPGKQTRPQFTQKSGPLGKNTKSLVEKDTEDYGIPVELKEKLSLCSTPVAINQITFSGDGKQLACALSNQTAQILNVPHTSKQRTYSGHNGAVQSVNFSHNGQLLLTSSKDNTARVWSCCSSEPVLTFTNQKQSLTSDSKDNPTFSKGIDQAMFYYVDKFILLSSGNSLFLYKYFLDFSKDDLKRYQNKSHYKLVISLPLEKAQNIAHFACINEFYSYIVLCAGSDKSLEIFDMNVGQSLLTIQDVHTRNAHCIKLNQGSKTFSLPPQTYDLFLTAAISDGVKMWDLRSNRCVRKYDGHSNRSHPVGMAWSPCSKYFALGSEDKSAYIYDVRQSNPCHRLTRHTDVVYDVEFHPAASQLVTATLDGKLHFYSDKI